MTETLTSQIAPATPSRRITWWTILGLLLVPVTIGGSGFVGITVTPMSMVQLAPAASVKPCATTGSPAPLKPALVPPQLPVGAVEIV